MKKKMIYNEEQTEKMKQIIEDWFDEKIKPNCFVSIQFPKFMRRTKLDLAYGKLYKIMYSFERKIHGRHWNKHKTQFISFAELGDATTYHFHLYFYDNDIPTIKFKHIFALVSEELRLPAETIDVKSIYSKDVYSYGAKELLTDENGEFDSSRIITTEILFELYKPQSNKTIIPIKMAKESHYNPKNISRTNWEKLNKLCDYRKKQPINITATEYHRKRIRIYIPD